MNRVGWNKDGGHFTDQISKVFSDFKLVMDQINGLMLTKDVRMIAYKALILETTKQFEDIMFINVLKEKNLKAGQVVIEASQLSPGTTRSVLVEVLNTHSMLTYKQVQTLEI